MRSFIFGFLLVAAAHAQSSCGGLTSVKETSELSYPPIARAAHISGSVILMASFDKLGHPESVQSLSGPIMLRKVSEEYVRGWAINEFSGPRTCPIVITFRVGPENSQKQIIREDLQHVSISVPQLVIQEIP